MTGVEVLALGASTSLLAGWRLYLVTFFTGLAMRLGWIDLPDKLSALDVLANPWVLLALAIVDPGDPVWQVASFLMGGGAAFLSHSGKAATRAMVNTSPEPVSNMVVSTGEDIATAGLLALALANPVAAALIALILALASLWLILSARRLVRRVLNRS
jgi:hypothetical protein